MIQLQNKNITIFESALFRTTSTVFHNEDLILVVDPTWLPAEVLAIRNFVNALKDDRPLYLLFTHSDYDHIIAAGAFEDAQTIASQAFIDNPLRDSILRQITDFDEGYYIKRDYPIVYPKVDLSIAQDGQQLQIGSTTLHFYLAPGHNADGIFTVIEPAGIWIVGDYLSNIEFPYIYESSMAYQRTLAKVDQLLLQHAFQLLIPGHGDFTTSKAELIRRQKESEDYILKLRNCILEGQRFDLEKLWSRYDFPAGMLPFHQGNEKLMRKELEK